MSDSVTKWYEMQQEEKAKTVHSHAYVWVLDLEDAKVYCYSNRGS